MRPSILLPTHEITRILLIKSYKWHFVAVGSFYVAEQAVYFNDGDDRTEHHIRQPHYYCKLLYSEEEMFGPVSSIAAIRT